jgi:hypothetical protein
MDDANDNEHQPDARELRAVAAALEGELERLQENLETHRLLDHPEQQNIVRQLVRDIDERQDRLLELNALIDHSTTPPTTTPTTTQVPGPTKH